MDPTLAPLARGLPRSALDALWEALARIPAARIRRGRALARNEILAAVGADSRGVRANVLDGHQYVSRWAWSDDGAASLCSCVAGRDCEHAWALGVLLLAEARRAGRWNHARWARVVPAGSASEPVGRESGEPAIHSSRSARHRHEQAVEALSHWADRGTRPLRRLRAVLHLEPGADASTGRVSRARLLLEARATGPGLEDAPRTWRQLEQMAGELKRHPTLLAPPEARLLRALTAPEFAATDPASGRVPAPGGSRIELTSERMQALFDRVPESPHFTWSETLPAPLAERAALPPGGRVSLQTEEVRVVPVCEPGSAADASAKDASTSAPTDSPPRLELALEWPDGATRLLSQAVLLSPLGLTAGGRTHVALVDGRFVRIVDEPPREVVKLLEEGGLALQRSDGAVLERLSRSFPVVRSALRRLTRVHDVDVVGSFELDAEDWLRVRVFATSHAAGWAPGAFAPEGTVFEYRPG